MESAEEIRECTRGNFPERTSTQDIELVAEDRVGNLRTLKARLHWKRFGDGSRIRIQVESPEDVRGSTYLVIESSPVDDVFVYLPALRKVRRISTGMMSGQLWGTDFSYEDIKQIQGIMLEGRSERRADASVAGRDAYVLAFTPAPEEGSSYEQIVFSVDQQTCVVLVADFFESHKGPTKTLVTDAEQIVQRGDRFAAREFEMRDLRDETRSWLRVVKVENDVDVPDRIFNPALLGRGR